MPEVTPVITPRQTQVLQLMSKGSVRKQIARSLKIRPATVDRLAWQAQLRLEAENHVHAVSEAIRRGLIV